MFAGHHMTIIKILGCQQNSMNTHRCYLSNPRKVLFYTLKNLTYYRGIEVCLVRGRLETQRFPKQCPFVTLYQAKHFCLLKINK